MDGEWVYKGIVTQFINGKDFWAPSVIKIDETYYMYISCERNGNFQYLHVASSDSPLGPFKNEKCLYNHFSIDSHIGYAVANTNEQDLKKVNFKKITKNGGFSPHIIKNDFEEGTGHHSVIKCGNEYYAIYHGRDIQKDNSAEYVKKELLEFVVLL